MYRKTLLHKKNVYLIAIAYVYSSLNNTLITITNIKSQTILFGSSGLLALKGAKRSTSFAGQNLAEILGKKVFSIGFRFIYIQIKGFGNSRKSVLKGFMSSNLKIIAIKDCTKISHNGCKAKKRRRI